MDENEPSTPSADPRPLNEASGHDSWPPLVSDSERDDPAAKLPSATVVTPRTSPPAAEPVAAKPAAEAPEDDLDETDDGTVKVKPHERGLPGKPLTPFQRRINQAVARQRDAEQRAEEAERRAQDAERRARGEFAGQNQPAAPNRDPNRPKPTQNEFTNYDEYVDALTDWKTDRAAAAIFQTQQQQQQQQQQTLADAEFNVRREAWIKDHPDYPDVVAAATSIEVSPLMEQFFRHDPAGVAVIDYLARHPEEAQDLARLAPGPAFVKLGRLAQIVETSNGHNGRAPGVASNGRPSQPPRAPAPLTPVGAGQHRSTDPTELEFGPEYVRRNNEAERQRRKAGLR